MSRETSREFVSKVYLARRQNISKHFFLVSSASLLLKNEFYGDRETRLGKMKIIGKRILSNHSYLVFWTIFLRHLKYPTPEGGILSDKRRVGGGGGVATLRSF